jgi:preprotein translocase subunit SecA
MKKKLSEIKEESKKLLEKTEEELVFHLDFLKKREKKEGIDSILPEWFAMVQEMSYRKIGLRHFDTQLLAGLYLHDGKIVEMKTGEGKTLVSSLPASLNALSKKGVHIVTVNEYLAERDQKWMGKIYKALGLTIGLIKSTTPQNEKKTNYNSDITYLTNSELVFDYLRDNTASSIEEVVQRPFHFCLIDEIDSILIDEARTPLILSDPDPKKNQLKKLYIAQKIINSLQEDIDFKINEKNKDIFLTDKGSIELQKKLGIKDLFDSNNPWILEIINALKSKYLYKKDKDYMIINNKIVIVDEFTGRFMEDRRWSMGIHEAIEAKEKVEIKSRTKTKSSITYQNFFSLYPKLSGMTGTAKTEEKEFKTFYNLDVIVLPTIKPMIRKDLNDLVYQNQFVKWKAVLAQSKESFSKGQPILIGTTTIEKSEFLSDLFTSFKIPHQVLNAKPENALRESEIIAQAGQAYAVTIATNMAGRGTDIILGGNPNFKIKQKIWQILIENQNLKQVFQEQKFSTIPSNIDSSFSSFDSGFVSFDIESSKKKILEEENISDLKNTIENLPYSLENCNEEFQKFYAEVSKEILKVWEKDNTFVKERGGLFVIGTERHETRRIDNQLRGRAGRQGDPGYSQFYVSLDDDLLKIFGGDNIRKWVENLIDDVEMPLEAKVLSQSLENAQKKVESFNYEIRKTTFEYDEVLNYHRKMIFKARQEILFKNSQLLENIFLRYNEIFFDSFQSSPKQTIKKNLSDKAFGYYSQVLSQKKKNIKTKKYKEIWITTDLKLQHYDFYQKNFLKNTKTESIVKMIDYHWTNHIERLSYIKDTINWRAYGQQNPLIEYNIQALESFRIMLKEIRLYMIYSFLEEPTYINFFKIST